MFESLLPPHDFQGFRGFPGTLSFLSISELHPAPVRIDDLGSIVIGCWFAAILLELRPVLFLLDSLFATRSGRLGGTSRDPWFQGVTHQCTQSLEGQLTIPGGRSFITGHDPDATVTVDS